MIDCGFLYRIHLTKQCIFWVLPWYLHPKGSEIKQVEQVAKQFKMSENKRRNWEVIENVKVEKRNDANFSWKKLMEMAEDFLKWDRIGRTVDFAA